MTLCIKIDDESSYFNEWDNIVKWCIDIFFPLKVTKTKTGFVVLGKKMQQYATTLLCHENVASLKVCIRN